VPREDLSSASGAAPPLAPLSPLSRLELIGLGTRIARRTWADGLHRWFWGEGVALDGLAAFGLTAAQSVAITTDSGNVTLVRDWMSARLSAAPVIEHVNDVAPAAAAVAVGFGYERVRAYAEWVLRVAPRTASGALEHWPGAVWADTMFMAGAFLARLGSGFVDEAVRQYLLHARALQDETTGLFAHGQHRGETIWCHWGRANAWAALGAVEILAVRDDDEVRQRLERQLSTLARLQPAHGVWDVLVDGQPETAGIVETSAAAGIAAAMLRAPGMPASVREAGWLALRGSLAYVDDAGHLTRVSAGTILQLIPFGYSVIRSDQPQPWGQGLALTAIAAALNALPAPPFTRPAVLPDPPFYPTRPLSDSPAYRPTPASDQRHPRATGTRERPPRGWWFY
jgi:unsaturated rhamnogalacturonyl hydrolase